MENDQPSDADYAWNESQNNNIAIKNLEKKVQILEDTIENLMQSLRYVINGSQIALHANQAYLEHYKQHLLEKHGIDWTVEIEKE